MQSPTDLRVWHLSHVLGWATRKIATEVGISQASVVRTLHRLEENPPTEDEVQGFMSIATPPQGIPALAEPVVRHSRPVAHAAAVGILLISLAIAAIGGAFAAKMITPGATIAPAPSGQPACARYSSDGRIDGAVPLYHGSCPHGQAPVIIIRANP